MFDGIPYQYKYTVDNLRDGFKYFSAATAYDLGTTEIESLESGLSQNEEASVPAAMAGHRITTTDVTHTDHVGTLERLDGAGRVQVLLEMMGTSIPVTLQRSALAPAA